MNQFEYALLIQEIEQATTLKKTEKIMRSMFNKSDIFINWGVNGNFKENVLIYKIFKKAFISRSTTNNLPMFIKEGLLIAESKLFFMALERNITYKEFIDMYEFTNEIVLRKNLTNTNLKIFIHLIGKNPLNLNINYHLHTPTNYTNLLSLNNNSTYIESTITNFKCNIGTIVYLEDIKRELGNKEYTVIEDILNKLYNGAYKYTKEQIEKDLEITKNYVSSMKIIKNKLNLS